MYTVYAFAEPFRGASRFLGKWYMLAGSFWSTGAICSRNILYISISSDYAFAVLYFLGMSNLASMAHHINCSSSVLSVLLLVAPRLMYKYLYQQLDTTMVEKNQRRIARHCTIYSTLFLYLRGVPQQHYRQCVAISTTQEGSGRAQRRRTEHE